MLIDVSKIISNGNLLTGVALAESTKIKLGLDNIDITELNEFYLKVHPQQTVTGQFAFHLFKDVLEQINGNNNITLKVIDANVVCKSEIRKGLYRNMNDCPYEPNIVFN